MDWVEDQGRGLNILVNNAGGNLSRGTTGIPRTSGGDLEVNLFSAFELSLCVPLLTAHPGSCINVGSVRADPCAPARLRHEQGGLHQMTRTSPRRAEDGAGERRGPVYIRRRTPPWPTPTTWTRCRCTPMGRIGEPEEVAAAVAFPACRLPTSPANASRWTAGSCAGVQAGWRNTSTGTVEWARTRWVTLPSSRALTPRRPCEAIATRSQPCSSTASMMAWSVLAAHQLDLASSPSSVARSSRTGGCRGRLRGRISRTARVSPRCSSDAVNSRTVPPP